jgi:tetratricopeptide (TPR) repeat protein
MSLYAQGWALVQYLGSQADNANRFDQFLARHRSGVPARRAFAEQFPSETWPALMDQMRAYIQAGFIMPRSWKLSQPLADHTPVTRDLSAPEAEVALGLLGFFTGEFEMANQHLQAARSAGDSDDAALAALGAIADHQHRPAAAESLYAKLEAIPRRTPIADLLMAEGTYYRAVELARSDTLAARPAFELARGRFRRCLATDPGNLIASAGWARTFQFQHPPPAEALQALQKASDALPARTDLALSLFLLELGAGQIDAAARVMDSRLAATLPPADLVEARGMLEAAKH